MARGSPAPGQALRLGLATQRFRERDDLPLAPGVRHGRFGRWAAGAGRARRGGRVRGGIREARGDRKSTRLNSSHGYISYAVFCLKKKKNNVTVSAARGQHY